MATVNGRAEMTLHSLVAVVVVGLTSGLLAWPLFGFGGTVTPYFTSFYAMLGVLFALGSLGCSYTKWARFTAVICYVAVASVMTYLFRGQILQRFAGVVFFSYVAFWLLVMCNASPRAAGAGDNSGFAAILAILLASTSIAAALHIEHTRFLTPPCNETTTLTPTCALDGISSATMEDISNRRYCFVCPVASLRPDGTYVFQVVPVKENLFTLRYLQFAGSVRDLNEMVSEIRLVTVSSVTGSFMGAAWNGIKNNVSGLWSIVRHPILTVMGLWHSGTSAVQSVWDDPQNVYRQPLQALVAYQKEIDSTFAKEHGIDLDNIKLPETSAFIVANRNAVIGAVVLCDVATLAIPAAEANAVRKASAVSRVRNGAAARAARKSAHAADEGILAVARQDVRGAATIEMKSAATTEGAEHAMQRVEGPAANTATTLEGKSMAGNQRTDVDGGAKGRDGKARVSAEEAAEKQSTSNGNGPDDERQPTDVVASDDRKGLGGTLERKDTFYPKVDKDLEEHGWIAIPDSEMRQGTGANQYVKPGDGIAVKNDTAVVIEKKAPQETSQSGSSLKNDYIGKSRATIDEKVAQKKITREVGLHETKLAQAEYNAFNVRDGITGTKTRDADLAGKTIKPGYSASIADSDAIELALRDYGVTRYEKIVGSNGTVTYIWELPLKRPM